MPSDTERERTEAGHHATNVDRLTEPGRRHLGQHVDPFDEIDVAEEMAEHSLGTTGHGGAHGPICEGQRVEQGTGIGGGSGMRAIERPGDERHGLTVESIAGELGKRAGDLGERRRCALTQLLRRKRSKGHDGSVGAESVTVGGGEDRLAAPVGFVVHAGQVEPPGGFAGGNRVVVTDGEHEITQHSAPGGGQIDVGHIDRHGVGGDRLPPRRDVLGGSGASRQVAGDRHEHRDGLTVWERDEHGSFVLAVGRRGSGIGFHQGPDFRPGDDRTGIDTRPDPGHAIEFGARQFGVDAALCESDDGDHDSVGRGVLELPHQGAAIAIGDDRRPLDDIAAGDPHPCLVHRCVVETVLAHGRRRRRALPLTTGADTPFETPRSVEGGDGAVGGDAGDRPGEVADQGAERWVEWREVPAPEAVEESHGFVRRPFERPSGDRSLGRQRC